MNDRGGAGWGGGSPMDVREKYYSNTRGTAERRALYVMLAARLASATKQAESLTWRQNATPTRYE